MPSIAAKAAASGVPTRLLTLLVPSVQETSGASTALINDVVPRSDELGVDSAVFIADVSGFSALERRAETGGADSADGFSTLVNDVLGGVERLAWDLGGCVVHTAGDALICVFPHLACHKDAAILLAAECARRVLHDFETTYKPREPTLNVHGGVARGGCELLHLGTGQRRHLTVCGAALMRATQLVEESAKGAFLIETHPGAAPFVVSRENLEEDVITKISKMSNPSALGQHPHEASRKDSGGSQGLLTEFAQAVQERDATTLFAHKGARVPLGDNANGALSSVVASYVSDYFLSAFDGDALEGSHGLYTGGREHICSVFVHLCDFGAGGPVKLGLLNYALLAMREETARLDGTVDVLLCDDKGFVFKALFGLFGRGIESAESRGALLAVRVVAQLRRGGISARVGVASGVAFCGAIEGGDGRRLGFTMLSSTGVTLAARLMCAADRATVLCSPSVFEASRHDLEYKARGVVAGREGEPVDALSLKGFDAKIPVHIPSSTAVSTRFERRGSCVESKIGEGDTGGGSGGSSDEVYRVHNGEQVFGRRSELDVIEKTVARLIASGGGVSHRQRVMLGSARRSEERQRLERRLDAGKDGRNSSSSPQRAFSPYAATRGEPIPLGGVKPIPAPEVVIEEGTEQFDAEIQRRREGGAPTRSSPSSTHRDIGADVVLIRGDAGMGKSALLQYVHRACDNGGGVQVIRVIGRSFNSNTPFVAADQILAQLLPGLGGVEIAFAAVGVNAAAVAILAKLLPSLSGLLEAAEKRNAAKSTPRVAPRSKSVSSAAGGSHNFYDAVDDRRGPSRTVLRTEITADADTFLGVERERRRHIMDICTQLLDLAVPVAVIVDDAHWLDEASWELLSWAAKVPGCALFIAARSVGPSRPKQSDSELRFLAAKSPVLVDIGPLNREAARAMLLADASTKARLSEMDVERILAAAEGSPLFLKALAFHAHEQGDRQTPHRSDSPRWMASTPQPLDIAAEANVNLNANHHVPDVFSATFDTFIDGDARSEKPDVFFGSRRFKFNQKVPKVILKFTQAATRGLTPFAVEVLKCASCVGMEMATDDVVACLSKGIHADATDLPRGSSTKKNEMHRVRSATNRAFSELVDRGLLLRVKSSDLILSIDDVGAHGDADDEDEDVDENRKPSACGGGEHGEHMSEGKYSARSRTRKKANLFFRFAHSMYREGVYFMCTKAQRQAVHATYAAAVSAKAKVKMQSAHHSSLGAEEDDENGNLIQDLMRTTWLADHWHRGARQDRSWMLYAQSAYRAVYVGCYTDAHELMTNAMKDAEQAGVQREDRGVLQSRFATWCGTRFTLFEDSFHASIRTLELCGSPLPSTVSEMMAGLEFGLYSAGLGHLTSGAEILRQMTDPMWLSAVLSAWTNIMSLSMMARTVDRSIEKVILQKGWKNATTFAKYVIFKCTNLAGSVRDRRESRIAYKYALSSIGVLYPVGFHHLANEALKRASAVNTDDPTNLHSHKMKLKLKLDLSTNADPHRLLTQLENDGGAESLAEAYCHVSLGLRAVCTGHHDDALSHFSSAAYECMRGQHLTLAHITTLFLVGMHSIVKPNLEAARKSFGDLEKQAANITDVGFKFKGPPLGWFNLHMSWVGIGCLRINPDVPGDALLFALTSHSSDCLNDTPSTLPVAHQTAFNDDVLKSVASAAGHSSHWMMLYTLSMSIWVGLVHLDNPS